MDSAIIVSCTEKSISYFTEMLYQDSFNEIVIVKNCCEAKRIMQSRDFDLCIINAPLADEFGDGLAKSIVQSGIVQVILVVKTEMFEDVSEKVGKYGVITVAKPINRSIFWNALKLANAAKIKMQMVQDENKKLLKKIEDIRIIDRAKCTLISYLRMTEQEAHKYIEKQAMDMRITKRAAAEGILKTYEY